MERMGSLVQIIHHKIHPYRLRTCRERELIFVPALSGKIYERGSRLWTPGCQVEEPVGHVLVYREFLDLGVDDVGLLCFLWERRQDGS